MAEIVILDCSASMLKPPGRILEARRAARAVVDCIPDGVWFAVVAGRASSEVCYPPGAGLAQASAETRAAAVQAIAALRPGGGTAFGAWLLRARDIIVTVPGVIAHAILLTDGRNESESAADFEVALAACRGVFQCDCRGVGTDWHFQELEKISDTLLGSADIVRESEDLADTARSLALRALHRDIARVDLHVRTPRDVAVRYLGQAHPRIAELSAVSDGHGASTYSTGAWGVESRDFHLRLDIPPGAADERMRAARIRVLADGAEVADAELLAEWTEDIEAARLDNPVVARSKHYIERMESIKRGLEAYRHGDDRTAEREFGAAARLGDELGDDAGSRALRRILSLDDAESERARLGSNFTAEDERTLESRASITLAIQPPDPGGGAAS